MHTMRKTTVTQIALMTLFAAAPLCAQRGDPTTKVEGTGKLPAGWMVRFDPPRGGAAMPPMNAVSFVEMGGGYHVVSGPAALYYNTKDMASGMYQISATFKQSKSMQHEAFGLFIGGSNLQDSTQNYVYFVIKPFDGTMLISHRASNGKPVAIVPLTPDPAVNKDAPADGSATNTLLIHVAKDTVHFSINGKLVKAIAKKDLGGGATDGQAGLRINHNIDMHIDGFAVKK
jgi:hypothetical protein